MSGGGDMSQKDPAIKLFGRKIPLPECQIPATSHLGSQIPAKSGTVDASGGLDKTEAAIPCAEASEQQKDSSDLGDGKTELQHTMQENKSKVKSKNMEEDKTETSSTDQDKTFKKPDKIVPCPRCNSLETKFCYFNNYNVNQPRHFCKNCQRYWTAGGTMRNVPVGAGRRKNKHLASQYRHIMVASDEITATRLDTTDSSGQQLISSFESSTAFRSSMDNGTVLKFGPDAPLCDSMESMLNLRDKKRSVDANSLHSGENGEEPSLCGSSVTSSSTQGNELSELNMQKEKGVSNELKTSHRLQCYPVPPWVLPWNPAWNNVNSMAAGHQPLERVCNSNNTNSTPMHWYPTPVVAVPGICPPNIPMQFLPPTYWGGMPLWAAGTGTMPIGTNGCLSPSSSTSNSCCSGNGSPTLGKHSRDTAFTDDEKSEKFVLVPKTLRIDDPNEASKSPIWTTLGIQPNKQESVSEGTSMETKELKGEGKDRALGVSQILEANPAAISRVHAFEEST